MPRFKKKLTPEQELAQIEESEVVVIEKEKKKDADELTIEDLPGIGPKGAQKLRESGYVDLMSIAAASAGELAAACEIGEATAEKIIQGARQTLDMGFKTAEDVLAQRQEVGRITTGSQGLDALLGGGVESLPPKEEIIVISNNKLERMEIGKLVDEQISKAKNTVLENGGITEIVRNWGHDYLVPSFDENFRMKLKPITAFIRHILIEKLFELKLMRGRRIKITAGHSIFVLNDKGEITTKRAAEIKIGDYILVPKKINIDMDKDRLNLVQLLFTLDDAFLKKVYVKNSVYVKYLFKIYGNQIRKILLSQNFRKRRFDDWKYEGKIPLSILKYMDRDLTRDEILEKYSVKFGKGSLIKSVVPLNEDILWFLGFCVAECGININSADIGISQEIANKAVLERSIKILKQYFDLEANIYKDFRPKSKQYRVAIGNYALWSVFKSLGLNKYSYEKRIPEMVFCLRKDKIISFLEGFYDGDKQDKRGTVGFCTSSKKLADDISLLLHILGEIPTIVRSNNKNPNYKAMYNISVFKLKNIKDLGNNTEIRTDYDILPAGNLLLNIIRKYKLSWRMNKFYSELLSYQPTVKTIKRFLYSFENVIGKNEDLELLRKLLDSDIRMEKVISINQLNENPLYVYDLEVSDSPTIDNFIGGNYVFAHNTQNITETYGGFSSGKSQVGFQLAVNVQLPKSEGGLNGTCLFIDTEGTFSPQRIIQMAEAKGLDPQKVLKNIYVGKAWNSDHQVVLADKAKELIREKNVKLVVIDSIMAHFRADYSGRGELAPRQQKLNRHIHALQKLSDTYNVAVYVTNQVMARPDVLFGDPTAAVGGHILAHGTGVRIYLRKSKASTRIARLIDSPYLPEGEAVFKVTEKGIED